MPRFVARPVVVEAWQFSGSIELWPESFRLVMRRRLGDGTIEVVTRDGMRVCRSGDWLMRGGDGEFVVVHESAFEASFEELTADGVDERSAAGSGPGGSGDGSSGQRAVAGRRR